MSGAKVAADSPAQVEVEAGKTYLWCACGLSHNQPFCDGSHQKTDIRPVAFKAQKTETLYFCRCKQTKNAPLCDGSHRKLRL